MASRVTLAMIGAMGWAAAEGQAAAPVPNAMLSAYFAAETERLSARSLAPVRTLEDWTRQRGAAREQLQEMLGLLPYPEKTDIKATVTGRVEHPEFFVEKLHYQSMPGLYVTGNVYVPRELKGKAPAILYVCGHSRVAEGKVAFGAKANYQHHGAWFARHGYVCLIIDTIQLGELEGLHHGTYREGMWWWNARGYTPEGVEAWNCIRALDYLQSRSDVDGERLGMTGRSGGGAYTWFTAALDERVKVAVPVAGITDLKNHVVDGCVAGHCDCMFMVNTYRWDYAKVAALLAPRPLLIANSDKDAIFPLDGVVRLHGEVARVYRLHGATDKLGLLITEGPHKDTQDLQVPTFRWFNRFLKKEETLIRVAAEKFFKPAELKVFSELPAEQRTPALPPWPARNPSAPPPPASLTLPGLPADANAWAKQRDAWLRVLREKSFGGWPEAAAGGLRLARVRRRYMLLGQTQDGQTVWDIARAVAALRSAELFGAKPVQLEGEGNQAVNVAYASLFAEGVAGVEMVAPPASHHTGPDYLNVLRFLDVPQAVTLAAERAPVKITRGNPDDWAWTANALKRAGVPAERLRW